MKVGDAAMIAKQYLSFALPLQRSHFVHYEQRSYKLDKVSGLLDDVEARLPFPR